jgi:hypothetical protein
MWTNPKSFNQAPWATSTPTQVSYSGDDRGYAPSALPSPSKPAHLHQTTPCPPHAPPPQHSQSPLIQPRPSPPHGLPSRPYGAFIPEASARSPLEAQPCLRTSPGAMHSQRVNAAYVHHQAAHAAPPILPPRSYSPISSHTRPDPAGMTLGQRRAALRKSQTSPAPQPPQQAAPPLSQQRATLQASQPSHSAQPLSARSPDWRGAGLQDSSQACPSIQSSQRTPTVSSGRIPLRPLNADGAVRCDPAGHDPSQPSTSYSICGPYRPDNAPAEAFATVPAAGMKRRAEFPLSTDTRASSGQRASTSDRPPHPLTSRLSEACEAPASAEAVEEERYPWMVNRRDARGHLPTDAAFDCTTLYIPNSVSPTVMPAACITVV